MPRCLQEFILGHLPELVSGMGFVEAGEILELFKIRCLGLSTIRSFIGTIFRHLRRLKMSFSKCLRCSTYQPLLGYMPTGGYQATA